MKALALVPDYVHERHAEYLYRHHVMPGMTHEQYLDEPGDVLEWNTRIWDAEQRASEKRQARQNAGG